MPDYQLRAPGSLCINGKRTSTWYVSWSESRRSYRKSTGTADEAVARRFFAEFVAAMDAPPETFTIGDMVAGYVAEKPSQADHAKAVQRHLGHLSLGSLTRSQVKLFHQNRRVEGASNSTIARQCGVLRAAIQWAYKEGWIGKDRIPHIEAPKPNPPRDRFLTYEDATALYAAAFEHSRPHVRVALALALWTGQRMGAILELEWRDIDFESGLIFFRGGNDTKRRAAAVGMNWPLALTLADAALMASSDHVVSYRERPIKSMKKAFARCVKRAGLTDVRQHDQRRSAASWLLQAGGKFEEAAALLNDDIRTVQRHYARFNVQYMQDVAARIA